MGIKPEYKTYIMKIHIRVSPIPLEISPIKLLTLEKDEVHIWCMSTYQCEPYLTTLEQVLSVDERVKATRFYFQKDRDQFITARGMLRLLISSYIGTEPSKLLFYYGLFGKPLLVQEPEENNLCFNVSHSNGFILCALAWSRRIGIDLENVQAGLPYEELVDRFFSPSEKALFYTFPPNKKSLIFFTFWTLKEAYVKAKGTGLSFRLDQFDTLLIEEKSTVVLNIMGDSQDGLRWLLVHISPSPGYVAALAVESASEPDIINEVESKFFK